MKSIRTFVVLITLAFVASITVNAAPAPLATPAPTSISPTFCVAKLTDQECAVTITGRGLLGHTPEFKFGTTALTNATLVNASDTRLLVRLTIPAIDPGTSTPEGTYTLKIDTVQSGLKLRIVSEETQENETSLIRRATSASDPTARTAAQNAATAASLANERNAAQDRAMQILNATINGGQIPDGTNVDGTPRTLAVPGAIPVLNNRVAAIEGWVADPSRMTDAQAKALANVLVQRGGLVTAVQATAIAETEAKVVGDALTTKIDNALKAAQDAAAKSDQLRATIVEKGTRGEKKALKAAIPARD